MMNLKLILLIGSLMLSCLYAQAQAQYRNNNHIFEVAELGIIKVELLANTAGVSLPQLVVPTFEHKLPIHLMIRVIDAYDQLRQLQRQSGLPEMPDYFLVEGRVESSEIYALLETLNEGLDRLLQEKDLERPLGPESLYGKSIDDNYSRLWYLNRLLEVLVPPPDTRAIMGQLNMIEQTLMDLAKHKNLELSSVSTTSTDNGVKSERGVMLIALQNLHLLGRLQRRLEIEAIKPGPLTGKNSTISDLYDISRETLADLHRTRAALDLSVNDQMEPVTGEVNLEDLYHRFLAIHDHLVSMTRSQPL